MLTYIKKELKFLHILNLSLCFIFPKSYFHNSKTVNNKFFFLFVGCFILLSGGVYIYIYIYGENGQSCPKVMNLFGRKVDAIMFWYQYIIIRTLKGDILYFIKLPSLFLQHLMSTFKALVMVY